MRAPVLRLVQRCQRIFFVVACSLTTLSPPSPSFASKVDEKTIDSEIRTREYIAAFSHATELLRQRFESKGPRAPETLEALRLVGGALCSMGDLELGNGVWSFYLSRANEVLDPCDPRIIEAMYQLGVTSKGVASNFDDMLPHYQRARLLLDPDAPDQQALLARITMSEAHYYRYRDKPRSIAKFEEAIAILACSSDGPSFTLTEANTWLAWTLLHMGRHEEARAMLQESRAELAAMGLSKHALYGTIESALADLDALAGRWDDAERGYQRAVDLFALARRNSSSRFAEFPLHGSNLLALSKLKRSDYDGAWYALQRYRSTSGKRLANLRNDSLAPSRSARVLDLRRAVVADRSLRRHRDANDTTMPLQWRDVIDELEANARLFALEGENYATRVAATVSLDELQASLENDWAYVGWLESRIGNDLLCSTSTIVDSRWLYIVRSRGPIRWIPLWEFHENVPLENLRLPAAQYANLQDRAGEWALRVDDDPEMARLARELGQQELDAALPYLNDVSHLVFEFVDDQNGWRPMEAMRIGSGYVGDRFVVSYTPSADVFVDARKRERSMSEPPTVVAVGDAVFSRDARPRPVSSSIDLMHHRGSIEVTQHRAATNGDPSALNHLPRLPFAGEELEKIKTLYPSATILRGDAASEPNLRNVVANQAQRIDIMHVATHALSETPLRQRCSLALSRTSATLQPTNDGLVDALEIQLEWNLDADLVVLSGCQTAKGPGWFRGEPMGLATSLLGVGARSVVASLWKVDDLATARLMDRFYENLSGSYQDERRGLRGEAMSKAMALAEAKLWLREYSDARGRKPFAHPAYWSGFILIGDPN